MSKERNKIGQFITGHTKIGGINSGDTMSEASRAKIRLSLVGRNGALARNWQGGKTKQNLLLRTSTRFLELRQEVFDRDNWTCRCCGAKNGNGKAVVLHLEHIKPFAYFPELRFDPKNCLTLCRECHKRTDTFAGRAVKLYAKNTAV